MHLPDFGGAKRMIAAVSSQFLMVELSPDATFLSANDLYCGFVGQDRATIKGKHHSCVVDAAYADSPQYREFLAKIARGEKFWEESRVVHKGGRQRWMRSCYSPITGPAGALRKIVGIGVDIDSTKLEAEDKTAKWDAISRVQAVAEFTVDGKVTAANENFLKIMGYRLEEIQGRNHSMFVEPEYAQSSEYAENWRRMNEGEFVVQEFKRVGKGGREVWLEASYNPVFDVDHRVVKIVMFSNDASGRAVAVKKIGEALTRLAVGDVEQRIATAFDPRFEKLRVDFNRSVESLEEVATSIGASASTLQARVGEISTSSDELSRRTEQQAANLEETAAALGEITTTVNNTAEGAQQAHDLVANAQADADDGGAVVREAMAAMANIDQSAKQVSQIVGVIDEIAFQTNLLALNAGVEAARAGEAGRGFAVVASEVRALAQRSAEAAKEIKGLIAASAAQVAQGVTLVTKTGQALERIAAKVLEANGVVARISTSAQEQAAGLEQVNTAVANMDQVTQKNAAMVEETSAAAHALAAEAELLAKLMTHFQTSPSMDDPLRRELMNAAPHAFREPRPSSAGEEDLSRRSTRQATRLPAAKARAGGGRVIARAGSEEDDWREF